MVINSKHLGHNQTNLHKLINYKLNMHTNNSTLYKSSNYTVPVELPDMYYEICIDRNHKEYIHYCSDIDYLLGLKSVEHLDPNLIKSISEMHPSTPLPPNVSDKDLIKFCKSRYIQEQSDCKDYYDILSDYADRLSDDYKATIEQHINVASQNDSNDSDNQQNNNNSQDV